MSEYDELVDFIIKNVGGIDNIAAVTHCVTRLRFTLKDDSKVNEKNLLKNDEIMTAQWSNKQYQVVIGMHVTDVYNVLLEKLPIEKITKNDGKGNKKGIVSRFIDIITKVITPTLGVMVGCSLILGVASLMIALNLLKPTDGTYIVLNAMGYSLFTFFPIILGYTSSKAFDSDPFIGMIIGSSLVFPNLLDDLTNSDNVMTLFSGSLFETNVHSTFLGLPIIFPENGYTSTVIPIVLAMFFISKFEKYLKRKIPQSLHFTFVPFLTVLVGVPAIFLIFGPIANFASNIISSGILFLYDFSSIFAALVVGLAYTPLVILGLHWPLVAIGINNLVTTGSDYLLPMIFTAPLAQLAVTFAVYLKTKDIKLKKISVPAMISAFFCIIEPAIYGVTLPVKKRFIYTCIGTAVGSVIIGMNNVTNFASTIGVLGIGGFINPQNGDASFVAIAVIASIATLLVSFILTYFTFTEETNNSASEEYGDDESSSVVTSPLSGEVISLNKVSDSVFSSGKIGKGIAIIPSEGKVIAPFNGEITMIFPSGHAIGVTNNDGIELLIHIGLDTVNHPDCFNVLVEKGDKIKRGDVLIEFNLKKLRELKLNMVTPVIVTNHENISITIDEGKINRLDCLYNF